MRRSGIWLALAATLLAAGCEETTSSARVRPPAATPVATPAALPQEARGPLPLPANPKYTSSVFYVRPAIDVLVENVQAKLDDGRAEARTGNFDRARSDFDSALDLILQSGFQADSDPRLSKLFDDIGEAVNAYEASTTQSGAAQEAAADAETPAQPAPIDEIADLALPAGDPRLALKAEHELISVPHDLPLTVNESVLQYLSFFTSTKGRAIVAHGLERAGRYNEMIRRALREEGVPQDLIYLAQAESAVQPEAVSRAGARGIWQFMPYRGEEYDLERSYWVDERSDPEKATHAAARHLRDLYQMFGDWYLVMAAYNSGPMNVAKAIERTGYADFWELQKRNALPRETQNYVPIIIALALVAKAPAMYGVQVAPDRPEQAEVVKLDHSIDLHLVSDATGADLQDLRLLNPELLRSVTPDQHQFQLKLPPGLATKFQENLLQVPEDKWTQWRLHTVADDEDLSNIARRYHVTLPALELANHLEAHATVPAGFLLNVPIVPVRVKLVHYRVQRGDTLDGIADRFDVTTADLKRWNHIGGPRAPRGASLRIYVNGEPGDGSSDSASLKPARFKSSAANRSTETKEEARQHTVKAGETLYSIARSYGVSVSALRQSNPFLADRSLEAGDILTIQR
jgi:membrane-bound lytic murein transglycosylase D